MSIPERIAEWELNEGVRFFQSIGVREGSVVLDFGSGHGHYAVAAAKAAGGLGKVIALDSNPDSVNCLNERTRREAIGNIAAILADGSMRLDAASGSVDFVLYYDILHMPSMNRLELIAEARRVLRPGGVLSVLPFHMNAEDIKELSGDIMSAGFSPPVLLPETGLHFGMLYSAMEDDGDGDFDRIGKGTVYSYQRR